MRKVLLLSILQSVNLASAVVIPFILGYGNSEQDIFVLIAIYQASLLLFEIPTGLLASRYGEKMSIMLGFLLGGLYYLALAYFATTFWQFGVLQAWLGCGVAFLSGSLSSILKSYASHIGSSFLQLKTNYKLVTSILGIVMTISGGMLSVYRGKEVFLFQALLFGLMVVLVFSMNYDLQHKERDSSYGSLMKKSIKLLSSKEILGPSFLISSMLAVEAGVYLLFQTQYIQTLHGDPRYLGIWMSGASIVALIAIKFLAHRSWILSKSFLLTLLSSIACSFLCFRLFPSYLAFLGLYIIQVVRILDIPLEHKILSQIHDNSGSTALSLLGFYERILFIVLSGVLYFTRFPSLPTFFVITCILGVIYLYLVYE